jgi:hypothetical protein
MVYDCTRVRVRSTVEVSGKIFGTELSLRRDVNIRLAVTRHWTRHVTVQQPYLTTLLHHPCKGPYACVRPHRYMYGIYWNTVANVDASDSRCICICKNIARDLRLVASRLYRMAVTRPGSRAAMTVSPSLGADLLGCINRTRDQKRKGIH